MSGDFPVFRGLVSERSQQFLELLQSKLGNQIVSAGLDLGDAVIRIRKESAKELFNILKLDRELGFDMIIDITVIDWLDSRHDRFEVVYHFLSIANLYRLRVKVFVPEAKPEIASVSDLWAGANFMEREAWDMYGVVFTGHPDLRRILMYDEFQGYPLRKDYPVQGKQPRIPLRAPEVRNTSLDMVRPNLIQIGRKRNQDETIGA